MRYFNFDEQKKISVKRFILLLSDVFIFSTSAILAWLLRVGLEYGFQNYENLLPYVILSSFISLVVFYIFKLHRHFFRFFSLREFYLLLSAVSLSILITVLVSFTHFRLEGIQRSLPFMHWLLALGGLSAIRLAGRWFSQQRERRNAPADTFANREAVLLIGFTPMAEICLRSMEIFGRNKFFAIGILDENSALFGHHIRQCEVIGAPWELSGILAKMSIHGVTVRRIFLTMPREDLDSKSRRVMDTLEEEGMIIVQEFQQVLEQFLRPPANMTQHSVMTAPNAIPLPEGLEEKVKSRLKKYGTAKRMLDISGACLAGLAALPVMACLAPVILLTMGAPVIFWQERPGRKGQIIRIYKLRSLKHGVDANGKILTDEERKTAVGNFLRRSRLDELPQLYSILKGDMTFVGPRPLLPVDLPHDLPEWLGLRALARPGLTGWAQINGGKTVGKRDKVIMDIWYLANMSFALDLKVMWNTVRVALLGERLEAGNITQSYADLGIAQKYWPETPGPGSRAAEQRSSSNGKDGI